MSRTLPPKRLVRLSGNLLCIIVSHKSYRRDGPVRLQIGLGSAPTRGCICIDFAAGLRNLLRDLGALQGTARLKWKLGEIAVFTLISSFS